MNRVDELTLKLLDETISDEEVIELTSLIQSTENRAASQLLVELEAQLHAGCHITVENQVLNRIESERRTRVENGVMQAVHAPMTTGLKPTNQLTRPAASRVASMVVVAIATCVLLVLLASRHSSSDQHEIARLHPGNSTVIVLDSDGNPRTVRQGANWLPLQLNDTIEMVDATNTVQVVYGDGTTLSLLGETRLKFPELPNGSKQVTVRSGLIQADVEPQPVGRPLQIVTDTATLEVLGTTLGVEVLDSSTQLGVVTGRVAMIRRADGQRVEVSAGRFATATVSTDRPLQAFPFPNLAEAWSEEFESGLPIGWRTGQLVEVDHEMAVRTAMNRGRFNITSHNAWQEGQHAHCRIDSDSVLYLRIRQSRFARITIMLGTRAYPPKTGRIGGNLFYTRKAWNEGLPADTWKTISVPLKDVSWQMRQGKKVSGSPVLDELAVYLIHVSTMQEDAGLIVDRMWITNAAEDLPF